MFVSTLLCHKGTGRNMSPCWGEESFGKAINMSLLWSEDAPRRSRIVVKKSLLQNSPVPDKSRTKEKQSSTDSADYTDFF
jgi:hypothetical protein